MKFFFLYFIILLSCNQQNTLLISDNAESSVHISNELDLSDSTYFNLSKSYLQKVGKKEVRNASSIMNKEMNVTYYSIEIDSMTVTTDHTSRIYISKNKRAFGNILKSEDKVAPEINNCIPDKNPDDLTRKKQTIMGIYAQLVHMAIDWKESKND